MREFRSAVSTDPELSMLISLRELWFASGSVPLGKYVFAAPADPFPAARGAIRMFFWHVSGNVKFARDPPGTGDRIPKQVRIGRYRLAEGRAFSPTVFPANGSGMH